MTHAAQDATAGSVTLIGGGPGDWDLLTVRGLRRLETADVILADHLGPATQLEEFLDISGKEVIDVSKLPYGRQVAQEKINELLVTHAQKGKRVARLKGGDPYIFGRGFEELQACAAAGIACEVVPGVTSAISVPGLAAVPLTHRGMVHSFSVISGHIAPSNPQSLNNWEALAQSGGTLVVIMGVKNAPHIAAALLAGGRDPQTPIAVIQEGATEKQRTYFGELENLGELLRTHEIKPPAVYVIGEVAALAGTLERG
ncbi:MAG: uroporphyrinogen-III C-methyltransferase [Corynebacterium sp.]|nr:uroporphyrinogen-III C-methyltransferase [Corynebacterium sp.]